MLKSALGGSDNNDAHTELFKVTESYRSGAEGREKIDFLLRTLYALLEDLMFLQAGAEQLVRNTDILGELKKMSEASDFAWVSVPRTVSEKSSVACAATCCVRYRSMLSRPRSSAFPEPTRCRKSRVSIRASLSDAEIPLKADAPLGGCERVIRTAKARLRR